MSNQGSTAISIIKKLFSIFDKQQKRSFYWLSVLTFFNSIADFIGLTMIIPIVGLVLSGTYYKKVGAYIPAFATVPKNTLLLYATGIFFLVIVLKNLFGFYVNLVQVRFVRRLYITLSAKVLDQVYRLPLQTIQNTTSAKLSQRLTNYQISLITLVAMPTIILINEGIMFAITAVVMIVWNWQLFALLAIVATPVMGIFYSKVKSKIRQAGKQKNSHLMKLLEQSQEMVHGYTDIKIAGTEQNFKKRFRGLSEKYSSEQGKLDVMMFIPSRIIELTVFFCILLILLYCVFIIKDVNKIVATISLFSIIAFRTLPSINRLMMGINNINSAQFIFEDADDLYSNSEEKESTQADTVHFNKDIQFDHVSFRYSKGNRNILNDLNLHINRGEKVGIIGKSGVGKSTLINNILGFLQPTEGRILIDGKALSNDNLASWWHLIGYVRQDVFIMNKSFMENIAIGIPTEEIDNDRLQHAIRMASLTDLVEGWPDGLSTMLTEKGSNLSGGQKQRIAIARAIYKGAQVLIFDEATSSLDSKTEEEITNAIQELGHESLTILIIAHRYTSLKHCDKIYQMEQGKIIRSLSYSELQQRMTS